MKKGTKDEIDCRLNNSDSMKKKLITAGEVTGPLILFLAILAACYIYSSKKMHTENQLRIKKFLEDYRAMKPTRYTYVDLKRITNNFKEQLGEGGYGTVFKGKISDEILVAVKLLHDSTTKGEEFVNEVATMGRIHHVNVVRLIGFCADGFRRALIYEFIPKGSLDNFILSRNEQKTSLGWDKKQEIALGIARGIEYLHQGCEQRILHFDIKPHNVLLDDNFTPKITDFGLAKLCEKGKTAVSMTAARGTMGYMAPEVYSRQFGNVSYKSDIYSFGMLLLEMVGRTKNIDERERVNFPELMYRNLVRGNGEDFGGIQVEKGGGGENIISRKLAVVGLWCIQWNPVDRPSITCVLQMLEGNGENLNLPPNSFTSSTNNSTLNGKPLDSVLEIISESEIKG